MKDFLFTAKLFVWRRNNIWNETLRTACVLLFLTSYGSCQKKNFFLFWISFPNVGGWGGKWLASLYNASSAVKKSTGAHKRGSSHSESQMSTDNICRISGHFTMTVDHGDSIFSPWIEEARQTDNLWAKTFSYCRPAADSCREDYNQLFLCGAQQDYAAADLFNTAGNRQLSNGHI